MARLNNLLVTGISRFLDKIKTPKVEADDIESTNGKINTLRTKTISAYYGTQSGIDQFSTGSSGQVLTSDGTNAKWQNISTDSITSGTLPVSRGGTGKTTGADAANYLINSLETGGSTPTDSDYYVSQYAGGGSTYTTYYRRPVSALWSYIKGKIDANGSYTNKNTFSNVKVGSTTVTADTTTDTLELVAGSNVTLTPDATNDKVTIIATDTTYNAGTGLSLSGTTFNHSNSITAGSVGTTTATSGTSIYIPFIRYDAQGHITSVSSRNHTIDLSSYTNQNAFSNIKVGSTTVTADTTTDTLELVGSGRVTLTPDAANDKVTINVPNTIPAQQVTWQDAGTDNIGTSMVHTANAFGAIVINPILRANRLSGLKAAGITIEYSRDSGATWTTYSASEVEKRYLFTQASVLNPDFTIGNAASGGSMGQAAGVCRLRIIIDTLAGGVYTNLKAFHLNISTNSSNDAKVTITAALASDPTNYSLTICSNRVLSGWSGWNLIPCNFTTYGNTASSQYQKIKFEFFDNGNTSSTYKGLNILKILGYGGMGWMTPTYSAKYDDICFKKFIAGQNEARAYFSNGVQTNTFYGGNAEITNNLSTTSLNASEADIDGELTANSINAGNLVVTGDATFSNDLRGNLIGTINGKSCSLTMTMDTTDTKQLNISFT